MSMKQNDEYYEQARERAEELKAARATRSDHLLREQAMEDAQARGEREYFEGKFDELKWELRDLAGHFTNDQLEELIQLCRVTIMERDPNINENQEELPF